MSLYDKANTIFSGAAAAGGDRTAYNILPVEKLKAEELAKELGDTHWTKNTGISFVDGEAVFTDVVRYARIISRDKIFKSGRKYRVSFEIEDFVGEQVDSDQYNQEDIQTTAKLSVQQVDGINIISDVNKSGKYSALFTAKDYTSNNGETFTSNAITFKVVLGSVSCKIKNVSIKEVRSESNDFTLLRSSNLTATRMQADGKIEKGRQNFALNSNRFDTDPWDISSGNGTLTAGQYGYDQSYNAWKFECTSSGGVVLEQPVTPTTDACTWSFYVKNGPSNTSWSNMVCRVDFLDSEDFTEVIIDLSDGSKSHGGVQGGDRVGYESEAVGADGWYRVAVSFERRVNEIKLISHSGSSTGVTVGDFVFIQNSQLEPGSATTTYIDTDESEIAHCAGVLEDHPRYDYTGNVNGDPVLMLEPFRTNKFDLSEVFYRSPWTTDGVTVENKEATSPDGSKNASRIQEQGTNGDHFLGYSLELTSGKTYTVSIFAKEAERSVIQFSPSVSHIASSHANFDLSDGSVGSTGGDVTASIEDHHDDWYRCSMTFTATATATATFAFYIQTTDSAARGAEYQGNTSNGILVYGAQIEEGPYVTSYIPTYGSSASRSGEAHNSLGSFSCELAKPLTKSYTLFVDLKVDYLERDKDFDDIFIARRDGNDAYALRIEGYHNPNDNPTTYTIRVFDLTCAPPSRYFTSFMLNVPRV